MLNTSILFIIFNRPHTTRLAFEAIRKVKPKQLFVVADAPRDGNKDDIEKCKLTRALIQVDWDCDLKTLYHEHNLGCSKGPSTAITWFFEHVAKGIILEDDCIAEKDFFFYCEELLKKYENDNRVFSICGSNLGFNYYSTDSYFVSKFMNMSGWATWRRTANSIDYSLSYWKNVKSIKYTLYKRLRYNYLDYDYNWINFWDAKIKEVWCNDNVTFWDYQWMLNQLQNNMVSIIPSKNLVKNIGFDENATHTINPNHPIAFIETQNLSWPLKHPDVFKYILMYENIFIKNKWLFFERIPYVKLFFLLFFKSLKYILKKFLLFWGFEISKNRIIKK